MARVAGDAGVGQNQDFRDTAVICFQLELPGVRITFRKSEDISIVRSAPGINALKIIAHDHEVAVPGRQQVNQVGLNQVGILIFIHHDVEELFLIFCEHFPLLLKKLKTIHEQVVKIHCVQPAFLCAV